MMKCLQLQLFPFDNKGADEDVFYAYGISAGLIRVAGLNDIEKLDYENLKYDELSKNLLVRYIATGMLWKMGDMFQLSIELYDTKDKKVVWSDRCQEKWDNLTMLLLIYKFQRFYSSEAALTTSGRLFFDGFETNLLMESIFFVEQYNDIPFSFFSEI